MRMMGYRYMKLFAASLLVLGVTGWAEARPAGTIPRDIARVHYGQVYLFVAPGAYIGNAETILTLHAGGGGEFLVFRGLGIGAEVGGIAALTHSGGGLGLISANGLYHFAGQHRVSPFLTGGYSSVFGRGQRHLVNFGVGLNYWFQEGKGIRLEFRDHIYADDTGRHLLGVRIGFALR